MGRIKTQLIKRITKDLMRSHGDKLSKTFEENKQIVSELLGDTSKKLRNVVAGYVTRLMKHQEDY